MGAGEEGVGVGRKTYPVMYERVRSQLLSTVVELSARSACANDWRCVRTGKTGVSEEIGEAHVGEWYD